MLRLLAGTVILYRSSADAIPGMPKDNAVVRVLVISDTQLLRIGA
jgi:hypothetical protein